MSACAPGRRTQCETDEAAAPARRKWFGVGRGKKPDLFRVARLKAFALSKSLASSNTSAAPVNATSANESRSSDLPPKAQEIAAQAPYPESILSTGGDQKEEDAAMALLARSPSLSSNTSAAPVNSTSANESCSSDLPPKVQEIVGQAPRPERMLSLKEKEKDTGDIFSWELDDIEAPSTNWADLPSPVLSPIITSKSFCWR